MNFHKLNQQGVIHLLFLLAAIGLIAFLVISSTASFSDNLFGFLFPKKTSQASGVVDLSLVPSAITVNKDGTFNLDISIDPKTEQVTATEIHVSFDSSKLEPISFTSN